MLTVECYSVSFRGFETPPSTDIFRAITINDLSNCHQVSKQWKRFLENYEHIFPEFIKYRNACAQCKSFPDLKDNKHNEYIAIRNKRIFFASQYFNIILADYLQREISIPIPNRTLNGFKYYELYLRKEKSSIPKLTLIDFIASATSLYSSTVFTTLCHICLWNFPKVSEPNDHSKSTEIANELSELEEMEREQIEVCELMAKWDLSQPLLLWKQEFEDKRL
jgi:hypothetical protein